MKTFVAILFVAFALASCGDDDAQETPMPSASSSDIIAVPFFVLNEDGEMPSEASDKLYEVRANAPVTAPDGHHITWGEFSAISGSIELQCTDEGVEAKLKLAGLIPNGVYTIWNVTFDDPGFQPALDGMNIQGLGAAGKGDGTDNYFTASSDGKGEISLLSPGGDLSLQGDMGACPLTDNFELHVVGAYHTDSQTYGEVIGPDGTFAEQFAFIFVNK